jgi:hypothetical protein
LAILRIEKNIEIEIRITLRIDFKSALFSQKLRAKIMSVVAILRVKNFKVDIRNT